MHGENISGLLVAENVSKYVYGRGKRKIYLLNNISFEIKPGEMAAIIGSSGAGKSTLINCLNGTDRPTSGRVLVDGHDMTRDYEGIKSEIGWVPQADIVHGELKVGSMLRYAARIRSKYRLTEREVEEKVDYVLRIIGLTSRRDTQIKKLSGGERKRASIASELISSPSLFFLDEPTSGLDPEAETELMKQLKRLSEKMGKTIVCITHTLQNIKLFDKIIFLAPGGRLCFFGSHGDALDFFGVDSLVNAYEVVSKNSDKLIMTYEGGKR